MKIIYRPLKSRSLRKLVWDARVRLVASHTDNGGKARYHRTGAGIIGDYVGTKDAKDHYDALLIEWSSVKNGPLFKIVN